MKAVYKIEQMQELAAHLNNITVSGIDNCKRITLCTQIIDNPEEIIEEESENNELEGNKKDNSKH